MIRVSIDEFIVHVTISYSDESSTDKICLLRTPYNMSHSQPHINTIFHRTVVLILLQSLDLYHVL